MLQTICLIGALASLAAPFAIRSKHVNERIIYWCSVAALAFFVFLGLYPDWKGGLAMAAISISIMTFNAYANSSFIKIRGKIHALVSSANSDKRDDNYSGLLTPAKQWWLTTVVIVIAALNIGAFIGGQANYWFLAGALIAIAGLAIPLGYSDGMTEHKIGRGQTVQFIIVSLITAGAFTLIYLASYLAGRNTRRPDRSTHRKA